VSQLNFVCKICLLSLGCRLTLIYKRIPYETVRVEFRDIQHTMKEIGAPPTGTGPDGTSTYSLPVIRDPATGKIISESFRIAQYLDEKYPDRRVIPTGTDGQQSAFAENMNAIIGMVSSIFRCFVTGDGILT
jgi:glutathione S-transferase